LAGGLQRASRTTRALWWALALLLCRFSTATESFSPIDEPPLEYRVKAVFLLNFTKFVEWPEGTFGAPDAPLSICILGEDPFGRALDSVIEGETINNRRIVVRRIQRLPLPSCQVLFMGRDEKDISHTLAAVRTGVLTVGEGDRFLREGGMIAFVLDNRRVRFDINQAAAASSGLQISSKLLNVARTVEK
jgi:hypothetical protein